MIFIMAITEKTRKSIKQLNKVKIPSVNDIICSVYNDVDNIEVFSFHNITSHNTY